MAGSCSSSDDGRCLRRGAARRPEGVIVSPASAAALSPGRWLGMLPPEAPEPDPLLHCPICQRKFRESDAYRSHLALHDGRTECNICRRVYSTVWNLTEHKRRAHGPDSNW